MPRPSLRCLLVLGAALSLAACDSVTGPDAVTGPELGARPTGSAPATAGVPDDAIPGQYVVVLSAEPAAIDRAAGRALQEVTAALSRSAGAEVRHVYEHALTGFAAQLTEAQATALARDPRVQYVEPDRPVHLVSTTQTNATWGLDRIDQRDRPLNGTYTYANAGAGVHAYILDTGIRYSHVDFGGRASFGFDAFGGDGNDGNGHGTHVAGTVGGSAWGVAKEVSLIAVRVLDNRGSGSTSGVIAGVDWVTANRVRPAVANMSLGGGASTALDQAVRNSIAAGVTYGLAAGNGDFLGRPQDACAGSPSRVAEGLTVGSTTSTDTESSFSNYGTCVDILAPGSSITSAWHTSNTATNTISGTSMATPHVIGAAALYLAANPSATPAQVADALVTNASQNKITLHSRSNSGGTPNRLLYTAFIGSGGGTPPPTNQPPTASFTHSCSSLTCQFTDTSTDPDGSVVSRSWTFGDGGTSSATNPTRTYASGGTYSVTLTVTDNGGATASTSQNVTVSDSTPPPSGFTLSGTGTKVQGRWRADLSWSGSAASQITVVRENSNIATVANSGTYTDQTNFRGGGSLTYRVCEAGTETCSNSVTIDF